MDTNLTDITDESLFGNDVAEDEDEDIFFSYAIRKEEIKKFTSDSKLLIATGLKGEGKSALLRLAERDFIKLHNAITIHAKSSSIAPRLDSEDQDEWVEAWKSSICTSIAEKIGEEIGLTSSSDKLILKAIAIESGARSQNILSKILSSIDFKINAEVAGYGGGVEVAQNTKSRPRNLSLLIQRSIPKEKKICILLDDIDHNFENSKNNRAKISGLLTACRYLSNETPQLKFRLTLRSNVWSIVKKEYASMSHISQYIINLRWSDSELNNMLATRIRSYIKRKKLNIKLSSNNREVVRIIFLNGSWVDEEDVDAIKPLANLSQRRPRWFIELCKLATILASNRFKKVVSFDEITGVAEEYGRKILDDMSVEYICEQPHIALYFTGFMNQMNRFKLEELTDTIQNRIVEGMPEPKKSPLEIAHFLFYIGFISARETIGEERYKHYSFSDQPKYLTTGFPGNGQVEWEVQTIFRSCLKMHTPAKTKEYQDRLSKNRARKY